MHHFIDQPPVQQPAAAVAALALLWVSCTQTVAAQQKPPTVEVAAGQRLQGDFNYSGFEPVVAADAKGRVIVAAMSQASAPRVLIWTSVDRGKSFSMPAQAPTDGGAPQFDPWLVSSGSGRFFFSLLGNSSKVRGKSVYLLFSEDAGKTWTTTKEFTPVEFDPDRPVFGISPNGKLAALAFVAGGPGGPLQIWFSSDGMKTWAAAATPITTRTAGGFAFGIVIDDSGRTVVSYRHKSTSAHHLQLSVTGDYGRTWQRHDLGRFLLNENDPLAEHLSGISLYFSGAVLAQSTGGVFHALSARAGEKSEGVDVWYRTSRAAESWSAPVKLSQGSAELRGYLVLAASGQRVHASWLEVKDGWCNVVYRGSLDGGKTWSAATQVSKAKSRNGLQTANGFRSFAGDYMGMADDGQGNAHVVWAVSGTGKRGARGEVWHTIVRLRKE